jgi:hypothetical protein
MAAQNATDASRLGNRTAEALAKLLTYRQLAQVLEAVQNLGKYHEKTYTLVMTNSVCK